MIPSELVQDLKIEKNIAVGDLLTSLADKIVTFAIHLAVAILVFYAGRFIVRRIHRLVQNILHKRNADPSLTSFLLSGIDIVLYFILIIIVVGILGIETSSFVALFASAGVAIGMALSGTLQNFAGGVLILFLKPYKVGEFIEAQGYMGTVKEIQLFNTVINTGDNKTIIIPNGPLFTGTINNYSRAEFRRVDWTVSVAYGTEVETARQAIMTVLQGVPEIIKNDPDRPINIFVGELAASSVDFTVRAWVRSADYWAVFFRVNELVYTALPKAGVEFPFPQMDVHLSQA